MPEMDRDLALGAGCDEPGIGKAGTAAVQPGLRHEPRERSGQAEIRLHGPRRRADLEPGWDVRARSMGKSALTRDTLGVIAGCGPHRGWSEDTPGAPGGKEVCRKGAGVEAAHASPRLSS